MKIFHVYNDDFLKGLEKNGFINKNSGFYIKHHNFMPEDKKFNRYAAIGGNLHKFIAENKFPFYVDRIAGGISYHHYPVDLELADEYKNLLGDWFFGFQLHEAASNVRIDWKEVMADMGGKGPFTKEEIEQKSRPGGHGLPAGHRRMGNAEYFGGKKFAETVSEFTDEMKALFEMYLERTNGYILPCDSFYMATKMQNEMGIKTFMPEVGWQIPQMRIAVALARGIAENHGKTWGVYYEPWRYTYPMEGCTAPCHNDVNNEWYMSYEFHLPDDFKTYGENGGSSRLLQRRIYYYALMSGAHYISEEYGLSNCFADVTDFNLSPYGLVKKELIEQNEKIGKVDVARPFAIVLPLSYSCLELRHSIASPLLGEIDDKYLDCPLNREQQIYYGKIKDVLKMIYDINDAIYGNEGHVMTNSRFGDMFDIIYADSSQEILNRYEYLIDADPDSNFAKSHNAKGHKVLTSENLETLENEIRTLSYEAMPCVVDKLHWLISVSEDGKRYLSIFNNEGNERTLFRGDTINRNADRIVNICFKEDTDLKLYKASEEGIKPEKIDVKNYRINVPATGFVIFEF